MRYDFQQETRAKKRKYAESDEESEDSEEEYLPEKGPSHKEKSPKKRSAGEQSRGLEIMKEYKNWLWTRLAESSGEANEAFLEALKELDQRMMKQM